MRLALHADGSNTGILLPHQSLNHGCNGLHRFRGFEEKDLLGDKSNPTRRSQMNTFAPWEKVGMRASEREHLAPEF